MDPERLTRQMDAHAEPSFSTSSATRRGTPNSSGSGTSNGGSFWPIPNPPSPSQGLLDPPTNWPPVSPLDIDYLTYIHDAVNSSDIPNYRGCHLPLPTHLNISLWHHLLQDYHNPQVDFLQPIKHTLPVTQVTAKQWTKSPSRHP